MLNCLSPGLGGSVFLLSESAIYEELSHWVKAASMKRMAAEQAHGSHPHAADDAVLSHGLHHVLRTSRVEAASRRQHGRKPTLIDTKNANHEFLHRENSLITSLSITCLDATNTGFRGLKTTAHPAGKSRKCSRTASRINLFMRLRTTALPIERGTVKPTRGGSAPSESRQKAIKLWQENRNP